jgi:hypothetical protein
MTKRFLFNIGSDVSREAESVDNDVRSHVYEGSTRRIVTNASLNLAPGRDDIFDMYVARSAVRPALFFIDVCVDATLFSSNAVISPNALLTSFSVLLLRVAKKIEPVTPDNEEDENWRRGCVTSVDNSIFSCVIGKIDMAIPDLYL